MLKFEEEKAIIKLEENTELPDMSCKNICSMSDRIKDRSSKLIALNDEFANYICTGQFEIADSIMSQMEEESRKLFDLVNRLSSEAGCGRKDVSISSEDSAKVSISYENNILKITFDRLLPHKPKKITTVDNERIISTFLNGFYMAARDVQHFFDEPVVLFFLNHFISRGYFLDHDNYITKPFVDAICIHYLKDDNPSHCAFYMDSIKDVSGNFSEIFVVPDIFFEEFLHDFRKLKGEKC